MKKFSYFFEAPLFYLLLYGINRVFLPDQPGFYGVSPHPYWAGVLLFSFRYGAGGGFTSGVVSAAALIAPMWFFGERYLFEDASFYVEPGTFVIVGALVGYGIQRYRDRIEDAAREKMALKVRERALQDEIATRTEIISELEKRIVTRMSTIVTLYEGARKLETVRLGELYPAILSFVAKVLEAEEAALYVKDGGVFTLKDSYGWSDAKRWPESFVPGEGVAGGAALTSKIVTVRDFLQDASTARDALMAGPIKTGEGGDVAAVLCIQKMPFLNFNSASINLFAFLLGWANRSAARASYVTGLKAHEIVDPDYGVYSASYFRLRLEEELQRSKTYYLPLSVGLVGMEGARGMENERRKKIFSAVGQLLRETCRLMDVVAVIPEDDLPFAVLFLTASKAQAEGMKTKILEAYSRLGFPASLKMRVGIASFTPQTRDAEQILKEAKLGLGDG